MPTTLAKIASTTHTATGNSGLLTVGSSPAGSADWDSVTLGINVTAASGTSPTLDITVQWLISDALNSLGNATYDETGGGVEDEWTLTSHGLQVNDRVEFTAVGTGATGYAVDTAYWVASVPNANTFTLAATQGGSAIEGTGDSGGTWTIAEKYFWAAHPTGADDFKPASSDSAFAQITAAGQVCETFRVRGDNYRLIYTLGGTTPSFTFTVSEHVV